MISGTKEQWKTLSDNLLLVGKWAMVNGLPDPHALLQELTSPQAVAQGFLRNVKFILTSMNTQDSEEDGDESGVRRKRNLYLKFVLLEFPYLQNCILLHQFPDFSKLKFFQQIVEMALEEGVS